MKIKIIILILSLISGCSYSVYTTGYPHLKTISILPIGNKTEKYELRDLVFDELVTDFDSDGRLKLVSLSPDCQLECSIKDYSDKIYSYSGSSVNEYKVRILFSVTFTDLINNLILWQDESLMLSEIYSLSNENSQFKSEDEVQEEIIEKLFETIMKNTLEGW
ncbi:MAG: LPS assembly lipoprotein LptE [Candidatus Tenebribacter davisii]|jgi:hypothetical protein|nr:LPS assembly lipoprotein LptE [Candidatus Tenebribacter davisii]